MLNQAQIIGYLGKDPEMRYTASGDAIANFSVATTEKWKDKATGEQKESTEWHKITFFGKPAEIIEQYVKKATLIYVSGKLTTRKWTDKEGVERYSTDIQGREFKILRDGKQSGDAAQGGARAQRSHDDMNDDIPF